MWRGVCVVVILAAACGEVPSSGLLGPPGPPGSDDAGALDAGVDGSPSGGPDAGPDVEPPDAGVEPTDLAMICGGREPVTLDDWEACYQRRKCEWEVGCVTLNQYRDVADCVASGDAVEGGRLAAERRERARAVAQGRASIDVAAFTQCLFRTSATHCNTALFDEACLTRFTGTIADNGSCYTDVDCASPDGVCEADCADACCLGTCRHKARQGEACTDFGTCEPGLQCSGTCVTGDIDSPCSDVLDCDWNAWCDQRSRRCKARFAVGAACTDILQCSGDASCIGLSITNSTPGRCRRNSRAGDPCDGVCHGNLYCDGSGICRDLPVLDDSCSPLIPCAGADTICDAGLCVRRSSVGVACGNQTCLPDLFCTSALGAAKPTCTARGADGASCAAPSHCESHLCSGNEDQHGICLPWSNTCLD